MSQSEKKKVLVVEDHGVVGLSLERLLNRQTDLVCCGVVDTVTEIIPAIKAHCPDVVMLDLALRKKNAAHLIPTLAAQFPRLRILVFSQLDGAAQVAAVLQAGADGFVTKEETTGEYLTALRTVLRGEIALNVKLAAVLAGLFLKPPPSAGPAVPQPSLPFSDREKQVLQLIGSGNKTAQIAKELGISAKTVESHRGNIKRKFGITTAAELRLHAVKWAESQVPASLFLKR